MNPENHWVNNFCSVFRFFLSLLHLKLLSWNLHFLVCFCYWPSSFMKGHEWGIFSKAPNWKPLFLIKIKIKQNLRCPNKEYNEDFKHFYQNIRTCPRSKISFIDQWLGKYCILGRIWTKQGVGEQVWFVLNTVGGGGVATPENIFAIFSLF